MKINVTVRTRDEERNIRTFCESYKDADKILVADGGSLDNTVEIAKTYPNVEVREFTERTEMANGYWRNNDSAHANFLFEWAKEENPDWIIYDDCDCWPNYALKQDFRKILAETDANVVMATRIYFWGKDKFFPKLSSPFKGFEPTLWAWRTGLNVTTIDCPPAYWFAIEGKQIGDFREETKVLDLFPPYCLLHNAWPNENITRIKVNTYRESGLIEGMLYPPDFGGPTAECSSIEGCRTAGLPVPFQGSCIWGYLASLLGGIGPR